ncbi:Protein LURP-one-related 8 [Abeliophyllum distichum]|uniref:Protein LURP-one-related 8 n=1 Tax=Abeliophyllum distichum TaxID=126358 RepID=A0ABD1VVA9_9LAMI
MEAIAVQTGGGRTMVEAVEGGSWYTQTQSSQRQRHPLSVGSSAVLTVWKKSLLFNCDGFTVFDSKGNLVFRVDNYMSHNKAQIVLMDASGNSLLTIRRKKLSLGDCWLVFDGETAMNPMFSVRKNINLLNTKCLAHVSSPAGKPETVHVIEGSYAQRCCAMYDENRRQLAEIKPKEAACQRRSFRTGCIPSNRTV